MRRLFYYMLILWSLLAFHAPQLWLVYFLHFQKTGPGGPSDVFINAGLYILWGLIHSLFARNIVKRAVAKWAGEDFVKIVYISIAGITQCLLLYFWRPLPGVLWETYGILYWILTFLFGASLLSVFYSSLILDYMEVLGIRRIIQRMRNKPIKPPALCTRGPYAYCRHPVYLFTIFFLWIGPVMTISRMEFAIFGTLYLITGTILEDRDTVKELGEPYEKYSKVVPLLIPRLKPWKNQ